MCLQSSLKVVLGSDEFYLLLKFKDRPVLKYRVRCFEEVTCEVYPPGIFQEENEKDWTLGTPLVVQPGKRPACRVN